MKKNIFLLIIFIFLLIAMAFSFNNYYKKKIKYLKNKYTEENSESNLSKKTIREIVLNNKIIDPIPPLGLFSKNNYINNKIWINHKKLYDSPINGNWLLPNGNYQQDRFFVNSKINHQNINNLKLQKILKIDTYSPIEASPITYNNYLFLIGSYGVIYAFDTESNKLIWTYHKNFINNTCCGPVNRGLAVYKNRLVFGTTDNKIVALNINDGSEIFISSLSVESDFSITAAPIIFDDKIFIGTTSKNKPAFFSCLDFNSGKILWKFNTIRKDQNKSWAIKNAVGIDLKRNINKEKKIQSELINSKNFFLGGASVWSTPAIDIKNNSVIFVTGDPQPFLDISLRPGDNLYSESLVSLNIDTGNLNWYFQFNPHDIFDLDFSSPPIIGSIKIDNKMHDVVITSGKIGYVFINDLKTGTLLKVSEPLIDQSNFKNIENFYSIQGSSKLFKEIYKNTPNPLSGVTWSPMAFDKIKRILFIMITRKTSQYNDGSIIALSVDSGNILWKFNVNSTLVGGLVLNSNNIIFFGDGDGILRGLSTINGKVLWTERCNAAANIPPIIFSSNNKEYLYFFCSGSTTYKSSLGNSIFLFGIN